MTINGQQIMGSPREFIVENLLDRLVTYGKFKNVRLGELKIFAQDQTIWFSESPPAHILTNPFSMHMIESILYDPRTNCGVLLLEKNSLKSVVVDHRTLSADKQESTTENKVFISWKKRTIDRKNVENNSKGIEKFETQKMYCGSIPGMGTVSWHCSGILADFQSFFYEIQGEESRLSDMTQNGLVSQYTKWQYTLLYMHLVHEICASARPSGSETYCHNSFDAEKILMAWFTLLQFGHLCGNRTHERYIVYSLTYGNEFFWILTLLGANAEKLKKGFLDAFKNKHAFSKKLATSQLENKQWRMFYLSLAYYRIAQLPSDKNTELALELHDAFSQCLLQEKQSSFLCQVYVYYRVIRKLAYIYLDLFFSGAPTQLQLEVILRNIRSQTLPVEALIDRTTVFGKLICSFEEYLIQAYYMKHQDIPYHISVLETLSDNFKGKKDDISFVDQLFKERFVKILLLFNM